MPCTIQLATCQSTLPKSSCSAQQHHWPLSIPSWKCFRSVPTTQASSNCPYQENPSFGESPTFLDRPSATSIASPPDTFFSRLPGSVMVVVCSSEWI